MLSAATPGIARKYLGRNCSGEVMETGNEVEGLKKGDRVCLQIDWPSCFQMEMDPLCLSLPGRIHALPEPGSKGTAPDGCGKAGFPRMVMHRTQPSRFPDSLTNDEALLLEPMACTVHAV